VVEVGAWVIEGEDLAPTIAAEGLVEAIEEEDLVEAEQIAQGAGIFRAAAAETGMPLGEDPEGTTDQAHAPTAAAVPPVWDLEVAAAAAAVAAVDGGGRHGKRT
jgi:hypothetical protein